MSRQNFPYCYGIYVIAEDAVEEIYHFLLYALLELLDGTI